MDKAGLYGTTIYIPAPVEHVCEADERARRERHLAMCPDCQASAPCRRGGLDTQGVGDLLLRLYDAEQLEQLASTKL